MSVSNGDCNTGRTGDASAEVVTGILGFDSSFRWMIVLSLFFLEGYYFVLYVCNAEY